MLRFSQLCESIAATAKKGEKVRLVAEYFRKSATEEASLAALYLSGHAFPRREERVLSDLRKDHLRSSTGPGAFRRGQVRDLPGFLALSLPFPD